MDDQLLFEQFHAAYDIEPQAGSFDLLRATLMRIEVRPKRRAWLAFQLPRRNARLLGAAILVALALASAGASIAINQYVHQTVPAKPHRLIPYTIPSPATAAAGCSSVPRQWASYPAHPAKMLSTTAGWAYGPMRTTDGGAHWVDVSPPSIPSRTPKNDEFFLDATHAWVAETASSPNACVDHVVIFSTFDGGRTWRQAAPISVRYAAPADVIWTGPDNHSSLFSFIDAQRGWLLLGSGPASAASPSEPASPPWESSWIGAGWRVGDLYRTTDGGRSWALVASNPGSADGCVLETGVSFSTATTGWIIANCPGPDHWQMLVTHDGGVTWRIQALPIHPPAPQLFTGAPVFFDQQHGLLFLWMSLLVTSDGGNTWSVRPLPVRDSVSPFDFINPSEGWAIGTGDTFLQCDPSNLDPCMGIWRLYHTNDGGKTWVPGNTTNLLMPTTKDWPPAYLHFVDSKTGFLDPGGPVEGFFRTTDGGHTWTAVNGPIEGPPS